MLNNRLKIFLSAFVVSALLGLGHPLPAAAGTTVSVENAGFSAESTAETPAPPVEDIGFPQLNASTYASQVFWLLVSFVLMYTLMSKIALPRVGGVIDLRQSEKSNNLERAGEMSEAAEKIKADYEAALAEAHEEARSLLAAAGEEISTRANAESARFGDHARTRIATAEQTIVKAKKDALSSLADISAEIAAEMVNKIAGAQMSKAEAKKVAAALMEKQ